MMVSGHLGGFLEFFLNDGLGILGKCYCLFGLNFSEGLFERILVLVSVCAITFVVLQRQNYAFKAH